AGGMAGQDGGAGRAVVEEDVERRASVGRSGDEVGGGAFERDAVAVRGEDREVGASVGSLGGGGARMAHQADRGGQPVEQEDVGRAASSGLPGDEVGGAADENHPVAVVGDGRQDRCGVAGGGGGGGRVADQGGRPGGPVAQEDVGAAVGVHLSGHEVDRGAGEGDPAAVAAHRRGGVAGEEAVA